VAGVSLSPIRSRPQEYLVILTESTANSAAKAWECRFPPVAASVFVMTAWKRLRLRSPPATTAREQLTRMTTDYDERKMIASRSSHEKQVAYNVTPTILGIGEELAGIVSNVG
jgi:hypothetical protein